MPLPVRREGKETGTKFDHEREQSFLAEPYCEGRSAVTGEWFENLILVWEIFEPRKTLKIRKVGTELFVFLVSFVVDQISVDLLVCRRLGRDPATACWDKSQPTKLSL